MGTEKQKAVRAPVSDLDSDLECSHSKSVLCLHSAYEIRSFIEEYLQSRTILYCILFALFFILIYDVSFSPLFKKYFGLSIADFLFYINIELRANFLPDRTFPRLIFKVYNRERAGKKHSWRH